MSSYKGELTVACCGFDETYAQLADRMVALHLSRVAEMPRIELYLDQVLSFVRMELAFMYAPDEKIITGSMVNNYVKQHLMPAPRKRRYTRVHLASLMFVCVFKQVLTIAQVAQVRDLCTAADLDFECAYDTVISLLERSIAAQFTASPDERLVGGDMRIELMDAAGNPVEGEVNRVLEHGIVLVTHKVYLSHLLALRRMRDQGE